MRILTPHIYVPFSTTVIQRENDSPPGTRLLRFWRRRPPRPRGDRPGSGIASQWRPTARRSSTMRALLALAILISGSIGQASAQQSGPAIPSVGTVAAVKKPIAKTVDFVGRVQGIDRVEIRARITGYLEDVLFK